MDEARRLTAAARLRLRSRPVEPLLDARSASLARVVAGLPPSVPPPTGISLVVVGTDERTARTHLLVGDDIDIVPVPDLGSVGSGTVTAVIEAVARTTSPLVGIVAATTDAIEPTWLGRLAASIGSDTVAAIPILIHPRHPGRPATPHDLRVREAGLDIVVDPVAGPRPVALDAGSPVDAVRRPTAVLAASGACIVMDRAAYERVGGLAAIGSLDAAVVDLCTRLRADGGQVRTVPTALVHDDRRVTSVAALHQPLDPTGTDWRNVVERSGAALARARPRTPTDPRRFTITVAAPSARAAPQWGDWHLAEALAAGLRAAGQTVRVQRLDQADDLAGRANDVHLVLRGQAAVRRTPGQAHALWVISHPESVDTAEYDDADLVLVASERHAAHVRSLTSTPVEVLLQATDHRRFRPRAHDPSHAHQVAIVATTRHVFRRSVADALAAGLRPAIYGSGWQDYVDPELIVSDFIPNVELPSVYSSVDVLINDHWDSMRTWGFVSNRIFDALACGTPIISDHLPEIEDLFGDAVMTYGSVDELADLVAEVLDDPTAARERADAGRQLVLAAHTFDHRARSLIEALDRHGLGAPW